MAVEAYWYTHGMSALAGSEASGGAPVDYLSDTIKVALITATYTPNQASDQYFSTPDDNEVSATGYTAGGYTLANKTLSNATVVTTYDNTVDPTWSITGSFATAPRYAVFYKDTGDPATSPLLWYVDFGASVQVTDSDFTLTLNASGIATMTATADV